MTRGPQSRLWTTTHQPKNCLSPEFSTLPRGVEWLYIGPIEQPDPDCSTPHRHGMILFEKRQRFTAVRALFPRTHREIVIKPPECFAYLNKTQADCLLELGQRPDFRALGTKVGVTDSVALALKEGATPREIFDKHPGFLMMHWDKISAMYTRICKWNAPLLIPRKVGWLCGPTGKGKTKTACLTLPDATIVDVVASNGNYFMNGYTNETSVIIDELRPGMPLCALLRLCGCNPCTVNIKGGQAYWNATRIIVTAPTPPHELFPDTGPGSANDICQLYRRLSFTVRLTDGDSELFDGDTREWVVDSTGISRFSAYFNDGSEL